jgi:hypothetical protein
MRKPRVCKQATPEATKRTVLAGVISPTTIIDALKYWEIVADNLNKAAWSYGYVSALDRKGRTIWIVDAHRGYGKRFIVRADEKLTAFLELESAISQHDWLKISLPQKSAAGPGSQALPRSRLPGPLAKPFRGLASQFAPQSSQAEQSATKQRNC